MTVTDRFSGVEASKAIKVPCVAASTGNLTLSGTQTIDGVAVATGDRVLAWMQNSTAENGIYVCQSSSWARAKDFDGKRDVTRGTLVYVSSGGTAYGGRFFGVTSTGNNVPGT